MINWIKSLGLSHKRGLYDWKAGIVSFAIGEQSQLLYLFCDFIEREMDNDHNL